MILGVLLLLAAGIGLGYPLWWNHRAKAVGGQLVKNFDKTTTTLPVVSVAANCVPITPKVSNNTVPTGLLSIPSLHMTAPVLQGLTDAVLNVAAGHDTGTPWPGETGESILESHDVSYFSQIDTLKNGALVVWQDHCHTYQFKVIGHEILHPYDMVYPPKGNGRGLALITCYPTDALFFVPDRYVLLTEEVASSISKATPKPVTVVMPRLRVPAPPALVALGLRLDQNDILLGTLAFKGAPSAAWKQGPAPLDLETLALTSYFGAEKAIAQGNEGWWRDLSVPGLAMPPQWNISADVYVTEALNGSSVSSITLSSTYFSMVLVPEHGDLLIKSVTVH
jgi:sortase A